MADDSIFDLNERQISKTIHSMRKVLFKHFKDAEFYRVEATPEDSKKTYFRHCYNPFSLSTWPLKSYFSEKISLLLKSKEWKGNVGKIEHFLIQNYGQSLENLDVDLDKPDAILKLLHSANFKKTLPSFLSRVSISFDYNDYSIRAQANYLLNLIYSTQENLFKGKLRDLRISLNGYSSSFSSLAPFIDESYNQINPNHIESQHEDHRLLDEDTPATIAGSIARLELFEQFMETFKNYFYAIEKMTSNYKKNFLSLPLELEAEDALEYQKNFLHYGIVINAQDFLSYKAGIFIATGETKPIEQFHLNPFWDINMMNPANDITLELLWLIRKKMTLIETNIHSILDQYIEDDKAVGNEISREQAIKSLLNYYRVIQKSDESILHILDGILLPKKVSSLFCKHMVKLLTRELKIWQDLTTDDEVISKDFFEESKISWRNEKSYIEILNLLLEPLHTQKMKDGTILMSYEDVEELKERNFTCNKKEYSPKQFPLKKEHEFAVKQYILQVFQYVSSISGIITINKSRWIQFMVQSFSSFEEKLDTLESKEEFDAFVGNIRLKHNSNRAYLKLNTEALDKLKLNLPI